MNLLSKKLKVLIGRPFGYAAEHPDMGRWLGETFLFFRGHPDFEVVTVADQHSSRILLNRNQMAQTALKGGFDYLLMADPDHAPDMYVGKAGHPEAAPFVAMATKFMIEHPFSVIGAPALSDHGQQLVNVFVPDEKLEARRLTHAEAAARHAKPHIEQVTAIGTGAMMLDVNVFRRLPHPYFNDLYSDETHTELSVSQDIYFTSQCTNSGIGVYACWYSWWGHHKSKILGAPELAADEGPEPSRPQPHEENGRAPKPFDMSRLNLPRARSDAPQHNAAV